MTDVEALVLRALHAEADAARLRDVLRQVEWVHRFDGYDPECPLCDGAKVLGHAPDCALAAALKGETP